MASFSILIPSWNNLPYLRRGSAAGADPVLPEPVPTWALRWQRLRGALKRHLG